MATDDTPENIQPYMTWISKYPLLTEPEVLELHRTQHLAKCPKRQTAAKDRLVVSNLRLVVSIANSYKGMGLPLADLVNEGNIGLMKAVDKYDPEKGRLSTYATWWIKQAIRRALSNQSRTIRLPVHMVEKVARVRRTVDSLSIALNRPPNPTEIAESCGLNVDQVDRCLATSGYTTSLNATVHGEDIEVGDSIPDPSAIDPAENCERTQRFHLLSETLEVLNPRERAIISARFGLGMDTAVTLEHIGKQLGVTRERIRQLEAAALKKLRKQIASHRQRLDLMKLLGETN